MTIKSNDEISKIFSQGRRYSNLYATFIATEVPESLSKDVDKQHGRKGRVAFIAGKKHGGAVWRNNAKRRMREIYRSRKASLSSFDILFIAKPSITSASYSKVLNACEKTLDRFTE